MARLGGGGDLVQEDGFEPPTRRFSTYRSTTELFLQSLVPPQGLEPRSWASDARALSS